MDAGKDHATLDAHRESYIATQAGPSSQTDVPTVFLPPPGPSRRRPFVEGTQDLIARFQLLSAYDKFVRPYTHPTSAAASRVYQALGSGGQPIASAGLSLSIPGVIDKGKGREMPVGTPNTPGGATPGNDGGEGDDAGEEAGKGEKKAKNSYKHLIKGIPGKHSAKKDDYLHTLMLAPPKQRMTIKKFDESQRDAFAVGLEGLKGWSINVLIAESAQAREDRKRRKELKKLAKAQAQAAQAGVPFSVQLPATSTSTAPTPVTTGAPLRRPQTPSTVGVGTPRPQGPGPGPPSFSTRTSSNVRPSTPAQSHGGGLPRSTTPLLRPGSRGKKREHEEDGMSVSSNAAVGVQATVKKVPPPGSGGVKPVVPRPAKRPRTDGPVNPMGLPVPQQQPTPQGV